MSLSAQQLSQYLPRVRELIQKWEFSSKASTTKGDKLTGATRDVIVAFRTRPVLPGEADMLAAQVQVQDGEDERESEYYLCNGISVKQEQTGSMIAHVPTLKWNGPTLTQKSFEADFAFGTQSDNETVYQNTVVQSDMIPLVIAGGVACILAYGQTGTGKTFTMSSLELAIARNLFAEASKRGSELLPAERATSDGSEAFEVTVTFLEIVGKTAFDLGSVASGGEKKAVNIGEDKLGKVRPDVIITRVTSAAQLEGVIERCLSHRRTAVTTRNAASSRSHAVLTIRVKNLVIPNLEEGEFVLVDLAGSERYEDSKAHSKQLMDESRENNKSLLALKECVRARAKAGAEDGFVHIPYRTSRLTWVLKPIFDLEETRQTRTVVIAHVSPHIQDISHSVNTLSYAAPFRVLPPRKAPAPYNPEDPRTWDHEATVKWLQTAFLDQYRARRRAAWDSQAKKAKEAGKSLKPLAPLPTDQPCLVKLEELCPAPQGGIFVAKMYGAAWVQRCLNTKNEELLKNKTSEAEAAFIEVLKDDALGVYLAFSQMLLHARTRTRNNTIKTRKAFDFEALGEAPKDNEPLLLIETISEEDRLDFFSEHPQEELHKKFQEAWTTGGREAVTKLRDYFYNELPVIFLKERNDRRKEAEKLEKQKESERETGQIFVELEY
ncbi:hypothetical protein M422DRAFT_201072 [Sphaerobolus stellatus SS14]|nr:hypothetical protein M422DRAFT_201072 [Sphaerobolus stellatus SS14]